MAYYVDVFSPDTYGRFLASDRTIAGFNDMPRTRSAMNKVRRGDKLIGYISRISRWSAVLEVVGDPYRDDAPLFSSADDLYVNRFPVKPLVALPFEKTLPVQEPHVWNALTFTRDEPQGSSQWTTPVRNSLNQLTDADGEFLEGLLLEQASADGVTYPVDPKHLPTSQGRPQPPADVTPEAPAPPSPAPVDRVFSDVGLQPEVAQPEATQPESEVRESIRVQAQLAEIAARIGAQTGPGGLSIWVPRNDRGLVQQVVGEDVSFLQDLPLNYDQATNRTIEDIDVLWLRGSSIVRAFEVEHTTAVYSGLLRMADLLAQQPNMDIRIHIVAPMRRRDKVFNEIRRPAFTPFRLAERCTFLSYESVAQLHQRSDLSYLSDNYLAVFEEKA